MFVIRHDVLQGECVSIASDLLPSMAVVEMLVGKAKLIDMPNWSLPLANLNIIL